MARPKKIVEPVVTQKEPEKVIQPVTVERTQQNAQPTRLSKPVPVAVKRNNNSQVLIRDKKTGNTKPMAMAFAQALVRADKVNYEIVE